MLGNYGHKKEGGSYDKWDFTDKLSTILKDPTFLVNYYESKMLRFNSFIDNDLKDITAKKVIIWCENTILENLHRIRSAFNNLGFVDSKEDPEFYKLLINESLELAIIYEHLKTAQKLKQWENSLQNHVISALNTLILSFQRIFP